jgi:hypothetical protein
MRGMFLLLFLGYLLVYAIALMMVIAFCCALAVSFGVYVLSYVVMYTWARLRRRSSPQWHYERRKLDINSEKVQDYALIAGILSMVDMVLGFLLYAFTDGSWSMVWTGVGVVDAVFLFFWVDNQWKDKTPVPDHPTYGSIQDKHGK